MESRVWFCGAPADPVALGLARRVAGLGLDVVESPANADRAIAVLSPELAAADAPELAGWIADRGVDELGLTLGAGQADWDEDAETFVGDAVPAALRDAFRARPFVIDGRGADEPKLDRIARRLAGTPATEPVGTEPEPAPAPDLDRRGRQRITAVVAVVLGLVLVGMLFAVLGGSGGDSGGPSTASSSRPATSRSGATIPASTRPGSTGPGTTIRVSTIPATTVPTTSDASSGNTVSWIVIAVLATALAVALVQLARRPKASAAGPPPVPPVPPVPAVPAAAAPGAVVAPSGAGQVFISHHTKVDGPVAKQLAERLRERQLKAWIAPESVPPGQEWVFAIEDGLVSSQAALVLISPAALEKGWVRKEIQMIVDLEVDGRLYVVPVVVTPCRVPLVLGAYQWVEVADFDRAADELVRRFGAPSPTSMGGD